MRDPNLGSSTFKANPHPFYARLRSDDPVHRVVLPNRTPAFLVTRYDACLALLTDDGRFVKSPVTASGHTPAWIPAFLRPIARNMLDLDDRDHARIRRVVQKAFTPRFIEGLRGRVQAVTDQLLDRAVKREAMDVIRDLALPLPLTIISDMLGVAERDRPRFHRWSSRIVAADASRWHALLSIPSAAKFIGFVREMIRDRRRSSREDLTSALVAAEEAGDQLTEDETVSMIFLLLVAGHETTVNLIGNGTLALLENPDQLAMLRAEPGLVVCAVEELLRFEGPLAMATERYARDEVNFRDTMIPRGSIVYAVLASANRDSDQFASADALLLSREPNRHLAFGHGVHFCLGASLARLEGQIALNSLVQRFPRLSLHTPREFLPWRRGLVLRGVEQLPVLLS